MKYVKILAVVITLTAVGLAGRSTKASASAEKPAKIPTRTLCRVRSPWIIASLVAYVLGATISFVWAIVALERGTSPEELISLLTVFAVIGLLLGGFGQLMRAAAHGAVSPGGKLTDGLGKVVGLCGWSFGLVGAVMFAMEGTEAPEWLIKLVIWAMFVAPVATFLVPRIRR